MSSVNIFQPLPIGPPTRFVPPPPYSVIDPTPSCRNKCPEIPKELVCNVIQTGVIERVHPIRTTTSITKQVEQDVEDRKTVCKWRPTQEYVNSCLILKVKVPYVKCCTVMRRVLEEHVSISKCIQPKTYTSEEITYQRFNVRVFKNICDWCYYDSFERCVDVEPFRTFVRNYNIFDRVCFLIDKLPVSKENIRHLINSRVEAIETLYYAMCLNYIDPSYVIPKFLLNRWKNSTERRFTDNNVYLHNIIQDIIKENYKTNFDAGFHRTAANKIIEYARNSGINNSKFAFYVVILNILEKYVTRERSLKCTPECHEKALYLNINKIFELVK